MPMGCGHGPDDGQSCSHDAGYGGGSYTVTGFGPPLPLSTRMRLWWKDPSNIVGGVLLVGVTAIVLWLFVPIVLAFFNPS